MPITRVGEGARVVKVPKRRRRGEALTDSVGAVRLLGRHSWWTPILRKDAGEARNQFLDLLEAAEKGRSTIITRQPSSRSAGADRGEWRCRSPTAADARLRTRSRSMGKASKAARRMEPLDLAGLPEGALVLVDSAPIIYFVE